MPQLDVEELKISVSYSGCKPGSQKIKCTLTKGIEGLGLS